MNNQFKELTFFWCFLEIEIKEINKIRNLWEIYQGILLWLCIFIQLIKLTKNITEGSSNIALQLPYWILNIFLLNEY